MLPTIPPRMTHVLGGDHPAAEATRPSCDSCPLRARYRARYGHRARLLACAECTPAVWPGDRPADPAAGVSELAALAGSSRLRDYEAPGKDLPELAEAIEELLAAKATPRLPGAGAQAAGGDLVIRMRGLDFAAVTDLRRDSPPGR